jgi:hypothetical protein
MDHEIWLPGVFQGLGQPFGVPMSQLPPQQLDEPMPQIGSSSFEIGSGTSMEIIPARTKKRPHTKSRQGCLNCKARKVKVARTPVLVSRNSLLTFSQCQETQPHPCSNCVGRSMECVYPSKDQLLRRRRPVSRERPHERQKQGDEFITSASTASSLTGWNNPSYNSSGVFSTDDLRFLHHFLITAYPHLPFGSEAIWQTSLPAHAHEVNFTVPFFSLLLKGDMCVPTNTYSVHI